MKTSKSNKPSRDNDVNEHIHALLVEVMEWVAKRYRQGAEYKQIAKESGFDCVSLMSILHRLYRLRKREYDPRDWRYWTKLRRLLKATKPNVLLLIRGSKSRA